MFLEETRNKFVIKKTVDKTVINLILITGKKEMFGKLEPLFVFHNYCLLTF